MMKRAQPRARGQALVEFALVAPALFMVFLGIFEIGRLFAIYIALQQGAQEAARIGSLPSSTQAQIVQQARNQTPLIGAGLQDCSDNAITASACTSPSGGALVISCSGDTNGNTAGCARTSDNYLRVEMTYPFQPVPLVYPFGTITLRSWAQVRVE
jgi:Flp pilus assembly protein TadG